MTTQWSWSQNTKALLPLYGRLASWRQDLVPQILSEWRENQLSSSPMKYFAEYLSSESNHINFLSSHLGNWTCACVACEKFHAILSIFRNLSKTFFFISRTNTSIKYFVEKEKAQKNKNKKKTLRFLGPRSGIEKFGRFQLEMGNWNHLCGHWLKTSGTFSKSRSQLRDLWPDLRRKQNTASVHVSQCAPSCQFKELDYEHVLQSRTVFLFCSTKLLRDFIHQGFHQIHSQLSSQTRPETLQFNFGTHVDVGKIRPLCFKASSWDSVFPSSPVLFVKNFVQQESTSCCYYQSVKFRRIADANAK